MLNENQPHMLHMVLLQIESSIFPSNIVKIGQHLT